MEFISEELVLLSFFKDLNFNCAVLIYSAMFVHSFENYNEAKNLVNRSKVAFCPT